LPVVRLQQVSHGVEPLAPVSLEPLQLDSARASAPLSSVGSRCSLASSSLTSSAGGDWLWGQHALNDGLERGDGPVEMAGFDRPEGAGPVYLVLWALELPLSILRWLTIPSSDGEWDRRRRLWTACTPPFALLLLSAVHADSIPAAFSQTFGTSSMPVWPVIALVGLVLSALVLMTSVDEHPPRWLPLLVVSGFVMTIIWLKIVADEMINLITTFGHLLNISTSILGLTVIAIGNSIGDFVADTAAARDGTQNGARMALAACFGSPVIMNIVSVGLSFTLRLVNQISSNGFEQGHFIRYTPLSRLARMGYILLYITMASHMVVFPLCGYRAPRGYAIYLFAIYATLIGMSLAIEPSIGGLNLDGLLCHGIGSIFGPCDTICAD